MLVGGGGDNGDCAGTGDDDFCFCSKLRHVIEYRIKVMVRPSTINDDGNDCCYWSLLLLLLFIISLYFLLFTLLLQMFFVFAVIVIVAVCWSLFVQQLIDLPDYESGDDNDDANSGGGNAGSDAALINHNS